MSDTSGDFLEVLRLLGEQLRDLVRAMSDDQADGVSVERVAHFAAAAVPGAEHAAISAMRDGGELQTIAGTSALCFDVDRIQFEVGAGPSFEALVLSDVVCTDDLEDERSWPAFARRVIDETGVRSALSYRLFMSTTQRGALNLYSSKPRAFDDLSRGVGALFASYASLTLMNHLHRDTAMHLERALESSREIGCAMGILMARQLLTEDKAFDLLRTASQHTHRKLRDIAREVNRTGSVPLPG